MKLTIDYSSDSLQQLMELLGSVLEEDHDRIEKVEIVPADDEVFRVSADGKVLFELDEEGFSVEKIEEKLAGAEPV